MGPVLPPRCLVHYSPAFLDHRTGAHPETRQRLVAIERRLHLTTGGPSEETRAAQTEQKFSLAAPLEGPPTEDFKKALTTVHTPGYLTQLEQFAVHGGGHWDSDTVVSPQSYAVAELAARTAVAATRTVLENRATTSLCLSRPPGHHALADQAMGFCLMNNVAIAARYAVQLHRLNRVLIIDWDVHHGNGTQDLFYSDAEIWFFSVHRAPFYPGTGSADETGTGPGLGTTRNLPLAADIGRRPYFEAVQRELTDFAARCQPELIFISAGFDAHRLDPIGSLGLESEDFRDLTRFVRQLAATYCGGKIVSLLEGGYHLQALAESVDLHLQELCEPG